MSCEVADYHEEPWAGGEKLRFTSQAALERYWEDEFFVPDPAKRSKSSKVIGLVLYIFDKK